MKDMKRAVERAAEPPAPTLIHVADRIWSFAEEPFKEFKSSQILREVLAQQKFSVTREFKNMPTAFMMEYGRGRPRIGILAEYDALPDCGLRKGTWGHGCGHNLLGAGSALAALIVSNVMTKRRQTRGTICLIGSPAEETLAGKVYMARDGAFKGFDAILAWHPGSKNYAALEGGSALDSWVFEFFGRTAHGAAAHKGRSALDALALMDHAVNILREHVPENVRMHSIITAGGVAPNVVPEYARSWYYVRGADRKQVDEIVARVLKCARGAAVATETRLRTRRLTGCYKRLPNRAFAEHVQRCLKAFAPIRLDRNDIREVRRLGAKKKPAVDISKISDKPGRGSSDEDNVSWLAPLGRVNTACWAPGLTGHHRETTRAARTGFAHKGMVYAAKSLALAALGFMRDAKLRARVRQEFRKRTKGFKYDPLIPRNQLPPIHDQIPSTPPRPADTA